MSSTPATTPKSRRRPAIITAGALGTAALALSMSGTLSAFSASITNSTNTGGVGTLSMRETGPDAAGATQTCETTATTQSATCSTINKYGGNLGMNTTTAATKTQTITLQNTGTMDASTFTLTPGDCTITANGNTGNLCNEAVVTITQDGKSVFSGTPTALKTGGVVTLDNANAAAGKTSTIVISFATTAATDATQGQSLSQPLTWTYNA